MSMLLKRIYDPEVFSIVFFSIENVQARGDQVIFIDSTLIWSF